MKEGITILKCGMLMILAAIAGVWATLVALTFYGTIWVLEKFFR